jgi:hypothetical protein
VLVFRFITPGSVEVDMLRRANSKRSHFLSPPSLFSVLSANILSLLSFVFLCSLLFLSFYMDLTLDCNICRKLDQLIIAKGDFTGKTGSKNHRTLESISDELKDLFNMDERERVAKAKALKGETAPRTIKSAYGDDGVLREATLMHLLERETDVPFEDGLENGYQLVKGNTTYSDLF